MELWHVQHPLLGATNLDLVELGVVLVQRALENDAVLAGLGVDELDLRTRVDGAHDHLAQLIAERCGRRRGALDGVDVVNAESRQSTHLPSRESRLGQACPSGDRQPPWPALR